MNYLQVIVLALIQGLAELLPISSSAHVIVAEKLMGLDPSSPELTFVLVMLHTGTMCAVLFYFWPRWRPLLASETRMHSFKMVVLATACTAALGGVLLFLIQNILLVKVLKHEKGEVEHLFKNLHLMAASLFAVGLVILASSRREAGAKDDRLTSRSSVWIGLVQGLCLPFRGFSRSGATISTALFRGMNRSLAEDFSFALAVVLTPPVVLWELRRLLQNRSWETTAGLVHLLLPGLIGMAGSFAAGLVALKLLSAALERGHWNYFGYYCLGAALVVFGLATYGL